MATTVLDDLRSAAAARNAERASEFVDMVRRCADGKNSPTPDELLDFLNDTGRDLDEFTAAVELRQSRVQAAATLKLLPDALSAVQAAHVAKVTIEQTAEQELVNKLAELDRQRRAAMLLRDKKIADAVAALEEAQAQLAGVKAARKLLFDTSDHAAKLAELRDRRASLNRPTGPMAADTVAAHGKKTEFQERAEAEQSKRRSEQVERLDAELAELEAAAVRP